MHSVHPVAIPGAECYSRGRGTWGTKAKPWLNREHQGRLPGIDETSTEGGGRTTQTKRAVMAFQVEGTAEAKPGGKRWGEAGREREHG